MAPAQSTTDGVLAAMCETRTRTLSLVGELTEAQMTRVITPLLSPLIWDLGHIANFEQRWLLGDGDPEIDVMYNPFQQPRADRAELPLPGAEECFNYMRQVRERVEELDRGPDPYLAELVIQHEQQHNETMLQLLWMMDDFAPPEGLRMVDAATSTSFDPATGWINYPTGGYDVGTTVEPGNFAYDNEQQRHSVTLSSFAMASHPVLNGEYRAWVQGGGYADPTNWSVDGRDWLAKTGATAPLGWSIDGGEVFECGFGATRALEDYAPVAHVSWFEADAFARAHGARLPSEFEWEVAASYDSAAGASGERRRYPWGDEPWRPGLANLDQLAFGTLMAGACCPTGMPIDMAGQVWEWTSSEFAAYPGFEPFCYSEYSAPFFNGAYRVLRGGSWATRPRSVDNRFRNWDLPQRRQIFSGFRLARDI